MTTPDGRNPDGSITSYGSWSQVQARTEADWKAGQTNRWNVSFDPISLFRNMLFGALQGLLSGGPLKWLSDLFTLRWDQVDRHDGEIIQLSQEQITANERLDDLESFAGTGVSTPLWTSVGGRDIVTFPDAMMLRVEHQDRDTK
ncbi:hypothetical protein SEA_HEXBUG_27 [Gordonia phage Hexbug]|nr:hypothetical protein SEA_HEXBUG_27 [Gordonia phage Hexbug]WNN96118.1 hypothetical protein SEA_NODIGI_27 [Gordonia phage Nodigi]